MTHRDLHQARKRHAYWNPRPSTEKPVTSEQAAEGFKRMKEKVRDTVARRP